MRTIIVAISATLALLAVGAPAHANVESFADDAGDARPKIDIRSVRVDNDRDRIRIRIKVQNLQADAYESWRVWIDTPRAGVPNYLVGLDQHYTFGETNGWRLKPNGQDPWGNVGCSNGGKRLFKRDIVRFSFKATCIKSPRKLRVAVEGASYTWNPQTESGYFRRDHLVARRHLTSWIRR